MSATKIDWCDTVWNPIVGCSRISAGCDNCYAARMAKRLAKIPATYRKYGCSIAEWCGVVYCDKGVLTKPLHWRKPRRIFVNSMGDLFHEGVPDEWLIEIFDVMRQCYQHTFLILTKRPERMADFCGRLRFKGKGDGRMFLTDRFSNKHDGYPICGGNGASGMNWVWYGVSVEDQQTADERILLLLQTPAVHRFVSVEPMLGAVDLSRHLTCKGCGTRARKNLSPTARDCCPDGGNMLDWVICGGETGPGARPMHPDWVRGLRDQCATAGVPFFFKQWGEWAPNCLCNREHAHRSTPRPEPGKMGCMFRCGKKAAGHLLDGKEYREVPA